MEPRQAVANKGPGIQTHYLWYSVWVKDYSWLENKYMLAIFFLLKTFSARCLFYHLSKMGISSQWFVPLFRCKENGLNVGEWNLSLSLSLSLQGSILIFPLIQVIFAFGSNRTIAFFLPLILSTGVSSMKTYLHVNYYYKCLLTFSWFPW